tara:strand:- start:4238 stop:4705 length:468 start_codon:yes stop_codon:yes gene_type:complete
MAFNRTEKSGKGTFITRLGESSIQWSQAVKPTSPGVYPQLVLGQLVSLDVTTGEIIATAASSDVPLGTVMVVNDERNEQRATVMLNAVAVIRTSATAAINVGAYVSTVGVNVTTKFPSSTMVGQDEWATGLALEAAGAVNDEVEVAILSAPVLMP